MWTVLGKIIKVQKSFVIELRYFTKVLPQPQNKSTKKFKFGELGYTKPAIDEEILAANDKLAEKIEKRSE